MARNQRYIDAPPERIFALLADPRCYPEWVVGAKQVRAADPGFPAPGTSFDHSVGVGPLTVHDHTAVLASDPPRLLTLEAHARPLGSATVRLELEPRQAGTCVTMIEDPSGCTTPLKYLPTTHLVTRMRNFESLRRLQVLVERRG